MYCCQNNCCSLIIVYVDYQELLITGLLFYGFKQNFTDTLLLSFTFLFETIEYISSKPRLYIGKYYSLKPMGREKSADKNEIFAIFLMGCLFVLIHGLALLITKPFESAGIEPAFENPNNPMNIIYIFLIMLVFTVLILLIAKFWKKQLIQFIILGAVGYTSFYAFFLPFFYLIFPS